MNLWSVFVTGLLAGGASCAVVQGGLLAGAVARRHGDGPQPGRSRLDDAVPMGGFLAGKLASHTIVGFLLGLVGDAAQLRFRTRAFMQIGAGVVMIVAANLFGVRGLRRLVPPPPPTLARFVRRRARSQTVLGPAVLGFLTVLIPCGVTLSVMVLAIASGSPVVGALGMAVFVLGTSPLFAVLGYALRLACGWPIRASKAGSEGSPARRKARATTGPGSSWGAAGEAQARPDRGSSGPIRGAPFR